MAIDDRVRYSDEANVPPSREHDEYEPGEATEAPSAQAPMPASIVVSPAVLVAIDWATEPDVTVTWYRGPDGRIFRSR